MKTLLSACILSISLLPSFAVTIAQWTFESPNTPPDLADSAAQSGILPNTGVGTASGVHASAATDWTTPAGNGSANSWSANNWAIGDYWQFRVSTVSFENIAISWDQAGSDTGPRDFILQYSFDGIVFTQIGNSYQVAVVDWSTSAFHNGFTFTPDFSGIASLIANKPNVYFRLTDNSTTSVAGGTVGTGGTDRVDNFTVSGTSTSVPDSSLGLWSVLGITVVLTLASRRKLGKPKWVRACRALRIPRS